MFGGSPTCPRCSKSVYAAEQVIGPGRKLYHKLCLACLQCNKRLDSYTLLEHNEQPYCKSCHLKNFGTPNLRHANLPSSPNGSPNRKRSESNTNTGTTPGTTTHGFGNPLKPNRSLSSPTSPTFGKSQSNTIFDNDLIMEGSEDEQSDRNAPEEHTVSDTDENEPALSSPTDPNITNTGRPGIGTIPRTVPLRRNTGSRNMDSSTVATSMSSPYEFMKARSPTSPVSPSLTGTRYGIGLTGVHAHSTGGIGANSMGGVTPLTTGGSPRKWGLGTPSCARCGKSVYFAEQVKAVGKTFHKACLRCMDCGTSLDSHRLRDHDGEPYCARCYQKTYGPQGIGYALLGKAGG